MQVLSYHFSAIQISKCKIRRQKLLASAKDLPVIQSYSRSPTYPHNRNDCSNVIIAVFYLPSLGAGSLWQGNINDIHKDNMALLVIPFPVTLSSLHWAMATTTWLMLASEILPVLEPTLNSPP